jgi:aspartate carbamoyltransferase catalytic subunit
MKKLVGIIEAQQFDKETIEMIFALADEMQKTPKESHYLLRGKIMATFFYEASTRTRLSFESAMHRLGGSVISTENAREFSSVSKGETLEDSIRIIDAYADVIVLRYDKEGGALRAQNFSKVPVINAGDGPGQHPTQALLDLYTIRKEFGVLDGLKIAMIGDLANGRTVRSLCYFLAKHFSKNEIIFVSPEQVKMKNDIKEYLDVHQVNWRETDDFNEAISVADVFYQTRVQKERFEDTPEIYEQVMESGKKLIIDQGKVQKMKETAIVMHPFPRVNELSYSVDKDPRARYFEQAENGLYVRMALLKMILFGY